jgi:DNA-binding transcriptional ArsR family regulator
MAATQNPSLALKAKLFRGLADNSRLAILETLLSGEKMVSEIVMTTGLSQPNVSGHLTCLKDCGLLTSRQDGRRVIYALASPYMAALMVAAESILSGVSDRVSCCSNYECKTAQKCVSDRKCASSALVASSALNRGSVSLPLAEG